jgi:hypothetical protein
MLALSASHLRHLSPSCIPFRVAEHFQQSLAITQYTHALRQTRSALAADEICAIIIAGIFLNMLAFTLPQTALDPALPPSTSWVFHPADEKLGWLTLQAGLRPLVKSMSASPQDLHACLAPLFLGSSYESSAILRLDACLASAPLLWKQTFDLLDPAPCDPECELGPAHSVAEIVKLPLAILAYLRNEQPVRANVPKSLLFVSKIHPPFRKLLVERNEKALWIFGYWLGLMCRFDTAWWCRVRVRRDYEAVGLWLAGLGLEKRPGVEGLRWRKMMEEYWLAPHGKEVGAVGLERMGNGDTGVGGSFGVEIVV